MIALNIEPYTEVCVLWGFSGSLCERSSEIKKATEPELKLLSWQLKQCDYEDKLKSDMGICFFFSFAIVLLPIYTCIILAFSLHM